VPFRRREDEDGKALGVQMVFRDEAGQAGMANQEAPAAGSGTVPSEGDGAITGSARTMDDVMDEAGENGTNFFTSADDSTTIESPTIEGYIRATANGVAETAPRALAFPGGPCLVTRTAQGKRKTNQDMLVRAEVEAGRAYFIGVADGMGGYAGGERASAIAAEAVEQLAASLRGTLPPNEDAAIRMIRERIPEAFATAQTEIERLAASDPHLAQMGTTMVLAAFVGRRYILANLGDSRGYRLAADGFRRITEDHTVENDAARMNSPLALDTPQARRMARALTRALRPATPHEPEIFPPVEQAPCYLAAEGDTLLLCSDGLCGAVPPSVIGQELQEATTLEDALTTLEKEALERGSTDNISMATVVFGERVRDTPSLRERVVPATLAGSESLRIPTVPSAPAPPVPVSAPIPPAQQQTAPSAAPPPLAVPVAAPISDRAAVALPPSHYPAGSAPAPGSGADHPGFDEPMPRLPRAAYGALITAALAGLALIAISLWMPDGRPAAAQGVTAVQPQQSNQPQQNGNP
jgi:protein phosphatase